MSSSRELQEAFCGSLPEDHSWIAEGPLLNGQTIYQDQAMI